MALIWPRLFRVRCPAVSPLHSTRWSTWAPIRNVMGTSHLSTLSPTYKTSTKRQHYDRSLFAPLLCSDNAPFAHFHRAIPFTSVRPRHSAARRHADSPSPPRPKPAASPSNPAPQARHATSRASLACVALIFAVNAWVLYLWRRAISSGNDEQVSWMYLNFSSSWTAIHFDKYVGLLTSAFSHRQWEHFFMNMLAFSFAAIELAYVLRPAQLILFYVSAGTISTMASLAWEKYYLQLRSSKQGVPMPSFHLGASGSVFAFLTFLATMDPSRRLYLFFLIPVQARILLPAITVFEVLCSLDEEGIGKMLQQYVTKPLFGDAKIDSAAHLGGIASGYLYALYLIRRRPRRLPF